jgi:hypothetical protein
MSAAGSNPLLEHVWGVSPSTDRVWAQIAGFAPSTKLWERLFMVLQAAIDDSYTEGGVFVLGGYIASAEAWANFSKEWELLLPTANRGPRGSYRFKMSEMINHINRVPPFYHTIENHVIMSISIKIDLGDFARAKQRIWSDNAHIVWGPEHEPYWFACSMLLLQFHRSRYEQQLLADWLPLDKKVDFYFDNRSGSGTLLDSWEESVAEEPEEFRELYGARPRFEDDEEFLPLQAADFWAWWVREGYETDQLEKYIKGDFGTWTETRHVHNVLLTMSEDAIVETLIRKIKSDVGLGLLVNVYDEKLRPKKNELPSVTTNRQTIIHSLKHILRRRRR